MGSERERERERDEDAGSGLASHWSTDLKSSFCCQSACLHASSHRCTHVYMLTHSHRHTIVQRGNIIPYVTCFNCIQQALSLKCSLLCTLFIQMFTISKKALWLFYLLMSWIHFSFFNVSCLFELIFMKHKLLSLAAKGRGVRFKAL